MTELRVGVVGTGIMGADHALTLHRWVSGAVVTRVSDIDPGRAAGVAAGISGAAVSSGGPELIADPEVDAVVIASSDATHAELVIASVRAGKPVLCEKPLAPTVAEAAGVVRAVGSAAGLLSLGFMRRFDPQYAALRTAVREGVCGPPVVVHCVSRGVSSAPGATAELSVTGSSVHEFDIVPWLLGAPVTEVSWQAGRPSGQAGFADPQVLLLRTADGVLTTLETFLNARYGYDVRCEVVGEQGTVALAPRASTVADTARLRGTGYPADWRPWFADAYRLELQAWVDSVGTGERGELATGRDGLVAAAVADAAITSMRDAGRWVPVEVPGDAGAAA